MPYPKFSLEILSRFLICAALLFSCIWADTFWLHQSLYQNKSKYTEEVFEVTGAEYSYDDSDGTADYSLIGTIAGREEQFEPRHFPKAATSEQVRASRDLSQRNENPGAI